MAHFEVVDCISEVTYMVKSRVLDKQGSLHLIETQQTKTIKPGFYGVEDVKIGDVIEIKDERLAGKAGRNPMLKKVDAPAKKKKASKKK
jgi:phosphoribosylformylglycinamidine (FGAM) synthase PurS component